LTEITDSWSPVDSPAARGRQLEWSHWGLELFLDTVEREAGQTRLGFTLELKADIDSAWTSVGYPRYRTSSGRWYEASVQGLPGSRIVTASREGPRRGSFWVQVSNDVRTLRLTLGDQTLNLQLPPEESRVANAPPRRDPQTAAPAPPGEPVRLEASLVGSDKPFGDGALDAGEAGFISFEVANLGRRPAEGVTIELDPPQIAHLEYPAVVAVPTISPGRRITVQVPIRADAELADTTLRWTIRAREPFGHDAPPIKLELIARAAPAAQLVLTDDFVVEGNQIPVPRDSIVTLRLRVRNIGQGAAEDVQARISPGDGVYIAGDSGQDFALGPLQPGEVAELSFRCYANQHAEQLSIHVDLSDTRSRVAPSRSLLALPLQHSATVARIVRLEPDPRSTTVLDPPPPPLTSDVDRFVPRSRSSRPDAVAVVLGVEHYSSAPSATYAAEDARTAARYFEHALGIPAQRIQLVINERATLGQLHRIFGPDGWIARRLTERTEVFVFFAGHGVSAGSGFAPYLMPADADLNYIQQTGFPLDRLIEWLQALDSRSTTVFLDACFSGLTREGHGLFDTARPLVVVPRQRYPSGLSLFSASQGTQLAAGYDEQGHGLFSYFLFKGLAGEADINADGSVTSGELKRYLEREVAMAAMELDREQDPSVFVEDEDRVLVERPRGRAVLE
jgi:hypothetical protein